MKLFNCYKILLLLLLIISQFILSQNKSSQINDRKILSIIQKADRSEFRYIPKKPGHYTAQDWRKVIDSTWGEGLPTAKKLQIFDRFWNDIDAKYPSFFNIDVNWDSLKSVYRPEVEAGVSRGRFAAIMCKMNFVLSDIHSFIIDLPIATDSLKSGTPIFVTSGRQSSIDNEFLYREYCHFGATLSPLPDSSLLVIDVIPEHPLGLAIGDIVLGYDGIPWHSLITEIFNADLPLYFIGTVGNSKKAKEFQLLTSAGENWHLFDTIDVIKKNGETIHLPTNLMQNKKMKLLSTYQLNVSGVEFPSFDNRKYVSWGVIDGTNIGYIYIWNWTHNGDFPYPTSSTGQEFKKAINTLISTYNISSLIIDSRYNTGGWTDEIPIGLNVLFNENKDIFRAYYRNLPNDQYSMKPFEWAPQYDLSLEPNRYLFDKPIALLISPLSESCGDMMPFLMRYHPMVKTFGLGTCGAFGITADDANVSDISGDWMYHRTLTDLKITNDPTRYLNHLNFTADEEVWFTEENVAKGEDDVAAFFIENWLPAAS